MKKKQLLALCMAGTLVMGMTPTAAFAEADVQVMTIEDTEVLETELQEEAAGEPIEEETMTELPAEEPAPESGEAVSEVVSTPVPEETSATETEAAETPVTEPVQEPEGFDGFSDVAVMEAEIGTEAVALSEEGTSTGQIYIQGSDTAYATLKDAIAAAENVEDPTAADAKITQIIVLGTVELSETVVVGSESGKKNISIAAGSVDTKIVRAEGFTGDMFQVTGGSALQFSKGADSVTGTEYPLTIDGSSSAGILDANGTIVSVESGSSFGLNEKVTLTGNRTSTVGAAIRNIGGTLGLSGGTITGNQCMSEEGAIVYSEGDVLVKGTVVIEDETDDRGLVLNKKGVLHVAGVLTDTRIRFLLMDPADQRATADVAVDPATGTAYMSLTDALNQIVYIGNAGYTLENNGVLKKTEATVTPPAQSTMELKVVKANGEGVKWTSASEAKLVFHATTGGTYYVTVIKQTAAMPTFAEVKANPMQTGNVGTIDASTMVNLTQLDSSSDLYVIVYAEDFNGVEAKKSLVLPLSANSVPTQAPTATPEGPTATPTPTTRAPYTPAVSESKVTGLENALEFYPGKTYSFSVTGAGSDNTAPVNGDVRWVPLYWSSYQNPTSQSQKQSIGTIGHKTGIKRAATFNMYIFFQKYVYDGTNWQPTSVVESMTYQFKSKAIDFTLSPTGTVAPTGTDSNGGGYGDSGYGGSYSGDDEYDPEYHEGEDADLGSSTATNANTADTTPIATMMMLASLSLVAGGYVLVRRR